VLDRFAGTIVLQRILPQLEFRPGALARRRRAVGLAQRVVQRLLVRIVELIGVDGLEGGDGFFVLPGFVLPHPFAQGIARRGGLLDGMDRLGGMQPGQRGHRDRRERQRRQRGHRQHARARAAVTNDTRGGTPRTLLVHGSLWLAIRMLLVLLPETGEHVRSSLTI
jgi:hypothetical protein